MADQADGAIVVSIPKSGTHMIAGVMSSLGYTIRGQGGEGWTDEERTFGGYWARRVGLLPELCNSEGYHWHEIASNIGPAIPIMAPPWSVGRALVVHELHLNRIDGHLYRIWNETGSPRLILNYRDPRACITSYVHWLRESGDKMAPTPIQLHYRRVLSTYSFPDALAYAIEDPKFPVMRIFQDSTWLLDHPDVLKVRYENLVGERGSGSEYEQRRTLENICRHMDSEAMPADPYSTKSLTYRQGCIHGWRCDWDERHFEVYERLYQDLHFKYGYGL